MVDIMFMVRHLRTGEEDVHPLFMCFDDPTALMTSYDSVDRTPVNCPSSLWRTNECSPPANSTMACKHACGWVMASARKCSTWSRAFDTGVCSHHCSTRFSRRCLADAAIMDSMVQLQRKKRGEEEQHTGRQSRLAGEGGGGRDDVGNAAH